MEINLSSIESEKLYEVAGGLTLTGHYFWPSLMLINKATFDGLTPEQQQAIRAAAAEIIEPQVMAVAQLDEKVKEHLAELNIPVVEPSPEFRAAFAEAVAPVVAQYEEGQPLVADFVAAANGIAQNGTTRARPARVANPPRATPHIRNAKCQILDVFTSGR